MNVAGLFLLLVTVTTQPLQEIHMEDKDFWRSVGSTTLDEILNRKLETGIAKNIIVFVGDGMGISTVTMARIYQGQLKNGKGEGNAMTFEKFPAVGLSKTYDVSHQVADSASTATAMFSGVKIKHSMLGLDAIASYNSCNAEMNREAKVLGMMSWAQENGKDTGIVTTTRITHATPAATYSHINHRDWECDSAVPSADVDCVKDIARQLVEDAPGNNFKVILGGGRRQFGSMEADPSDDSCFRNDGLDLIKSWRKNKGNAAEYVSTAEELSKVDLAKTDYLLGLFAPGHLKFVAENDINRPSLKSMTQAAITMLKKNPKGFVLMVESGRIDMAHHKNFAKLALIETMEFDEAIAAAVEMTDSSETLIIVTADHSHSVTMNGYPLRGNDILGLAENTNKSFFETITYANGPGYEYHHPPNNYGKENCKGTCSDGETKFKMAHKVFNCDIEKQSANSIRDIRNDTHRHTDIYYRNFAALYRGDDTHGGEDVGVFARGPMSHLLVGVYEQNYIGNVISYAACIGPEAHRCKKRKQARSSAFPLRSTVLIYSFIVLLSAALLN